MNLHDIPKLAPYFFIDPDLNSPEAFSMFKSLDEDLYSTNTCSICALTCAHIEIRSHPSSTNSNCARHGLEMGRVVAQHSPPQ